MKRYCFMYLLILSLAAAACGSAQAAAQQPPELLQEDSMSATASFENPLQSDVTPESSEMPSSPSVEKFVAMSKADLAKRLGVEANKIELVKSSEKLWLNAALGCPRPGVFYPSGRVPGFQIWLKVDGVEYIYNTDFQGTVFPCPELNPHLPNINIDPTPGVPIR